MTSDEIINSLNEIDEINENSKTKSTEELRQKLKKLHRTRHMKVWHDHFDIANHSHILIMTSFLYDKANYLTEEEIKETHSQSKPFDIQSFVEKPSLYIFGRSKSTDCDQLLYTDDRTIDLKQLKHPVMKDQKLYDVNRFFSADESV